MNFSHLKPTVVNLGFIGDIPMSLPAHQDSGIVNGEKTKTNSKPYMVSVQERNKETEKTEHMCGGFLVSDNFVMTAAHCYTR